MSLVASLYWMLNIDLRNDTILKNLFIIICQALYRHYLSHSHKTFMRWVLWWSFYGGEHWDLDLSKRHRYYEAKLGTGPDLPHPWACALTHCVVSELSLWWVYHIHDYYLLVEWCIIISNVKKSYFSCNFGCVS